MKKVEAIITPSRLEAVRESLVARGVQALSLTEVRGAGHEPQVIGHYRGASYGIDLHPKLKLEIVVRDEDAVPIAYTIVDAARSGHVGDGKVLIAHVEDAVRIRTGERGPAAVQDELDRGVEPRLAALG
ncbi:MAG TPA: P-II family nitrogen regulator [Candidatus Binatia bacterium]|nr:P-II family nitrogen regulator [Candidatus Binatia bacterium]